jgi:F-type H+-transporting ATPase subunit epsilon
MALSAVLGISPLRIQNDGNEQVLAIFGGLVNVRNDVVTVMTEKALWPDEIDADRAKADAERAERMREALEEDTDLRSNQIAMRRALVQIEVSSYPLIGRK